MNHIFVDFEMNPIAKKNKEARQIVRSEIIQIGAVKLDESYTQVGKYCSFVKPELNTIQLNITNITGITNGDVENAPLLAQALEDFLQWIGETPCRMYAWSDSDKKQLLQECRLKGLYQGEGEKLPKPFRRWMDFQRVYTRLMGLSPRSNLSLKNAMGSVEQDFAGQQHSAADDAENSAALLPLVKDREQFQDRVKVVNSFFQQQKAATTTLGDLLMDKFAALQQEEES